MTHRKATLVLLGSLVLVACGGSRKPAEHQDEKLVPEETQKRSREQYGNQQLMMDELGMTSSEQAGAQHENATQPVESEKYGKDKEKPNR